MLEKPDLPDEIIIDLLRDAYHLPGVHVDFLPLGADVNTAVYRITGVNGTPYFLKLRGGVFEPLSVLIPRFLRDQGIRQVIEPLRAADGTPWSRLGDYATVLYPFIEGRNAWSVELTDTQWVEFGAAVKQIQSLCLPEDLRSRLPVETYSDVYRQQVREYLALVERETFSDPVAARMAAFMRAHREEMEEVAGRAGALAQELTMQPPANVLCHADLHAGNLLNTSEGDFYIVDWDNPILAPKERDLMFIGAGIGDNWNTPREEDLFYQGYGPVAINNTALAYYRYERIVQDFAAYCQEILPTTGSSEDREQGLRYFMSNFPPGSTIAIARQTEEI